MLVSLIIAQCFIIFVHSTVVKYDDSKNLVITKRALQKSHEKPRIEKLSEFFLEKDFYDLSLINLLNNIAQRYFSDCTTVILYDNYTETVDRVFLEKFFQQYRLTYVHGSIPQNYRTQISNLVNQKDKRCVHFLIFIKDVMRCKDVISQRSEKVVVVAKSSQWRVHEYLSSEYSQEIANLLVVVKSDKYSQQKQESPYILYTHKLFVDALGSSLPKVLTSWSKGNFSKNVTLFQTKITHGFSGHRFIIATAHQPPYVIKRRSNERDENEYDGIEIRLIEMLSQLYNFSIDFKESPDAKTLGSGESVVKAIALGNINLGIGGIYITENRYNAGIFHYHNEDCASFISLASTALPRYRAIMGPFHWTVWLALIAVYLGAIFIFTYSDKFSLKQLIRNPEEIENMFWYVFGTFTNCFTFTGNKSWTRAKNNTTKLLVGIYWLFTIIITACYTGSIIAFVTLPVFPAVIDTIEQLLGDRYQIGMLDKGGWPLWFHNMSDTLSEKLLKKIDYVPDIESGLKNVTKAFFWSYALLGSREELKFVVMTNFTVGSRKSLLHISRQCFVPFKVAIVLPPHSVYSEIIASGIQRILQAGLNIKINNDVEWDILRVATGKLLAVNSKSGGLSALVREDRALTLDDTQGMFLLLGVGFLIGGAILISEIFGGCFNMCKKSQYSRTVSSTSSIPSNPRFYEGQTNRERQRSISTNEYHERQRSTSVISDNILFDRASINGKFGEHLVHYDVHEVAAENRAPKIPEEEQEPGGSGVNYDEEITEIFRTVLKEENDNDPVEKNDKQDTPRNGKSA